MKHPKIKPGDTFGYLTILEKGKSLVRKNGSKRGTWITRCKCGKIFTTTTDKLRRERRPGEVKSCGCFLKEDDWFEKIRPRFSYLYKECPKCKKTKERSQWGNAKNRLGGLKGICNSCVYETKDKSKVAVSTTMRKKKIKTSTPPWVDKEDIRKIYEKKIELEEQTGVILNVDHIYPLTHEKLCGLTVPWNLQITTQEFNLSKQNVMFSFNEEQLLKGSKLIDGIRIHKSVLEFLELH